MVHINGGERIAQAVGDAPARGVLARGLGRSYGDAAQNAGGWILDMTGHSRVHRFDEDAGTIEVDAGLSLAGLLTTVVPRGWFPLVTPGTRHVTIGGAIAADVHGKNHHVDGSFSAGVRSLVLRAPAGTMHVGPVQQPEVFWATVGGMGLTGIIDRAELQLTRIPSAFVRVETVRVPTLDELLDEMSATDGGHRFSVAWIDLISTGRALGRSVLTRGDWASSAELPAQAHARPYDYRPRELVTAPSWVPARLLNRMTMKAFNEVWFRRAPERALSIDTISSFFHPLDGVSGWNSIYGRRGFIQYQFVVPFDARDLIRRAIELLGSSPQGSFLAVLKQLGAQSKGHLSFPQPGWTLAVDVPIGVGLDRVVGNLDEMVAAAGGRVYFAKDACLRPERVQTMYPRLEEWRAVQRQLDPEGVLRSDLDRRLGLTRGGPR